MRLSRIRSRLPWSLLALAVTATLLGAATLGRRSVYRERASEYAGRAASERALVAELSRVLRGGPGSWDFFDEGLRSRLNA